MNWFRIIEEIIKVGKITLDQIMLILMKIRLNDPIKRLNDQFGITNSGAGKVFNRNILYLSSFL